MHPKLLFCCAAAGRVVVAAIVNLPDALVSSLFVLSFIPAPFTLDLVAPLLALAQTKTEKHAVLRRLVTLGFLSYNAALQQYSMHKVVREAACLLVHNLGENLYICDTCSPLPAAPGWRPTCCPAALSVVLAGPVTSIRHHGRRVCLGFWATYMQSECRSCADAWLPCRVSPADLPYSETRHNYAERVVASARRLVLPLIKQNRMLSARLAWSRLSVHVVQLLNWAFQEVKPEILHLYVSLAWDLTPLLSSSCSSHTLQGKW